MRWGDPITTTVRGQGRLLGSKLAWIFQSRRRITIFVLVVAVIVGSLSYGLVTLNNNNAFRAAEDPEIELPGLDYVEYTTQVIFSQKLALVPPEQLPDYDKIAIITELAGDLYFRISTVAERQDFLAAWDTSPEWRQFATQAESGEGGAWQWLAWLGPYCEGGGVAKAPSLLSTAQAQSSACILNLAELQTKKIVKAGEPIGLADFESDWSKFWQRALNTCSSDPGSTTYMGCLSTARFSKSYYNSPDLDRIYNTYWKDLKHLRTKKGFGLEEIARLKKIDKYFRLKLQNKMDEALGELGNLYFNIALSALPIERAAVWGIKGVSKVLGGMVDVAAKAPIGTMNQVVIGRGALQIARTAERIVEYSGRTLPAKRLSLTKIFSKSLIPKSLKFETTTFQEALVKKIYYATDDFVSFPEVTSAIGKKPAPLSGAQRAKLWGSNALDNSTIMSERQYAKYMGESPGKCTSIACAGVSNLNGVLSARVNYNEAALFLYKQKDDRFMSEGMYNLVYHETSHLMDQSSAQVITKKFSTRLGYCPLNEGVVESNAGFLFKKYRGNIYPGYSAYWVEAGWFDEVVLAIGRGQKLGKIKLRGSARQIAMDYQFGYGLDKLDEILIPGLPKGSKVSSVFEESYSILDSGGYSSTRHDRATAFINSLYK